MKTVAEHIEALQAPISKEQALRFKLEDAEWERDCYLDFVVNTVTDSAKKDLAKVERRKLQNGY